MSVRAPLHRLLPLALLAAAVSLPAAVHAQDEEAAQAIAGATASLEKLFGDAYELARSDLDDTPKRLALARLLASHLDTGALARRALGPSAERFDREAYADFAHEFARYLCWNLADRVAGADRKAEVVSARYDADAGVVVVDALGGDFKPLWRRQSHVPGRSKLGFALRPVHGEWRIRGIRIEGVDVAKNYRSQFESLLRSEEPDAITRDLRERNRKAEAEIAEAAEEAQGEDTPAGSPER